MHFAPRSLSENIAFARTSARALNARKNRDLRLCFLRTAENVLLGGQISSEDGSRLRFYPLVYIKKYVDDMNRALFASRAIREGRFRSRGQIWIFRAKPSLCEAWWNSLVQFSPSRRRHVRYQSISRTEVFTRWPSTSSLSISVYRNHSRSKLLISKIFSWKRDAKTPSRWKSRKPVPSQSSKFAAPSTCTLWECKTKTKRRD